MTKRTWDHVGIAAILALLALAVLAAMAFEAEWWMSRLLGS